MDLIIHDFSNRGVFVHSYFSCYGNISRIELLEYINELNLSFFFTKAYINIEG